MNILYMHNFSTYLSKMLCQSVFFLFENVTKKLVDIPGFDVDYKGENKNHPLTLVGERYDREDIIDIKYIVNKTANIYEILLQKTNDAPW